MLNSESRSRLPFHLSPLEQVGNRRTTLRKTNQALEHEQG